MNDTECKTFTPVHAAVNPVLKASYMLLAIFAVLSTAMYYIGPILLFVFPPVMIISIAIIFGTSFVKRGEIVLMIDENGVFESRSMTKPVPWTEIQYVIERNIYYRGRIIATFFLLKVEDWRKYKSRYIFDLEITFAKWIRFDGLVISARNLEVSTGGLRNTFAEAKAVGLLRS